MFTLPQGAGRSVEPEKTDFATRFGLHESNALPFWSRPKGPATFYRGDGASFVWIAGGNDSVVLSLFWRSIKRG
jgi:hypothetical protein